MTDESSEKLPDNYSELIKLILLPKHELLSKLTLFYKKQKRFLSFKVNQWSTRGQQEVKSMPTSDKIHTQLDM